MENAASWSISDLLTDVGTVVTNTIDMAAENKLLAFFLGCSVVVAGYGVFTSFRKRSKK